MKSRARKPGPAGGISGNPVYFDIGVGLAAAMVTAALPEPLMLVKLLYPSGLAVLCVIVGAAMPYAMLQLHGRVAESGGNASYRRFVDFAIRAVGSLSVLAMWFVIPMNLKRSGLVPDYLDEMLFVVGLIAIMAGVLAYFSSSGAAVALATGAALLGMVFSLPADVKLWLESGGPGPLVGIAGGAAGIVLLLFVGRFINRLDEATAILDAWLAKPAMRRITAVAGPFLLGTALSWWTVLYAGLLVARLDRPWAVVALFALGVVPYRILLIIAPPIRPIPLITGLAALAASMASLIG